MLQLVVFPLQVEVETDPGTFHVSISPDSPTQICVYKFS